MKKDQKFCQSCSMPLNKDPRGGGTNSDGTISEIYCSYCFQNGKFTQPDLTLKKMKDFLKNKLKEMGYPWFVASIFVLKLSKLERWKKK